MNNGTTNNTKNENHLATSLAVGVAGAAAGAVAAVVLSDEKNRKKLGKLFQEIQKEKGVVKEKTIKTLDKLKADVPKVQKKVNHTEAQLKSALDK